MAGEAIASNPFQAQLTLRAGRGLVWGKPLDHPISGCYQAGLPGQSSVSLGILLLRKRCPAKSEAIALGLRVRSSALASGGHPQIRYNFPADQ